MLAQVGHRTRKLITQDKELTFLEQIDAVRLQAVLSLDSHRQSSFGQFFTPLPIARMMTSMIQTYRASISLLDPGAGAGVLSAAFISAVCDQKEQPKEITVTAFELDENLLPFLTQTLECCRKHCAKNNIKFSYVIKNEDFIRSATESLTPGLFADENRSNFDLAVMNPPYGKINTDSETSRALRRCGIVTPNLYTAFLALAAELLAPNGELVAVTPRSFCNGTYYKPFRRYFTERMSFRRFHVFDSRQGNFDDDILQENIIFHAVKDVDNQSAASEQSGAVFLSVSHHGSSSIENSVELKKTDLIKPGDEELFIHLGGDELGAEVAGEMRHFQCSLEDLGLSVSTGKVVDFRVREFLMNRAGRVNRTEPTNGTDKTSATSERDKMISNDADTVPLIYPHNLQNGTVNYPIIHPKKFNAIRISPKTESSLIETGNYVLVKRFSAKEEKRRVTATLFTGDSAGSSKVGFENHLNYFHCKGSGLEADVARGLVVYLNSSLVDAYFRQFSGHTQVNAADLRYLKYPTRAELERLGKYFNRHLPAQDAIDSLIRQIIQP